MLPLLLLLPALSAANSTEPPKTIRKPIENCPSVGYFFERQDLHGHPGICYLCYCNDDDQAVCTIRDSERCDDNETGENNGSETGGAGTERRRYRRGLMDLFFDEAKKDVMMKSMAQANEEDCKPKASKSIGCPPKDWCTGCLVCDCDENSEWQCHVMSFCEDKTPRPRAKKARKMELNEIKNDIDTADADYQNDNLMKKKPSNKNIKRSIKQKKAKNNTSTSTKKDTKTTKKKSKTTTTTTTTATTLKPPMPKVAVRTLKKFIRKDHIKNGTGLPLIVIRKYVSTLSPIDSPELLKYKNDSQKLAQILYQQYEATTKRARDSHAVKREIKLEKILNNKQKRHFELKYNSRGRKPMNTKEHGDWNKRMKARITEREHMKTTNTNNFYSRQNELLTPEEKRRLEKIQRDEKKREDSKHKKKAKLILIPRKRRSKRNVLAITEVPTFPTVLKNETENISIVNNDQVERFERELGINKGNTSNMNNYKYTIDNTVTKKYDTENPNSGIVYESTSKYVDIISHENHDPENITTTILPNYINVDVATTTSQTNYNSVFLNLKNNPLNESFASDIKLDSIWKNGTSLETTTLMDNNFDGKPLTDKELRMKEIIDMETTTVIENNGMTNNTDNQGTNNTNITENKVKKVYISDIDTIITGLKKYTMEKWKNSNTTNEFLQNVITVRPNYLKSSTKDLEKMLQSFSQNTTKKHYQQNRMVAIKYLKKIYGQLLSTKNNKSRLNNVAVMESICDTFGPCKISTNKIEILNSKISELISETKKALDLIRVIKGFLQLIDGETNGTDKHINEESEFKSYVKKLNAVLTDTYETPLTKIQITHMNYIKNNTKLFVNSIGRFAFILNDILEIIHSERTKYDNLRRRKILIKKVTRHSKVNGPLHKIKNLFMKFNMLQSSFMRNMYQAISDLEKQNEQNAYLYEKNMRYQRDSKYQSSVNKYMNKINYNLEKLKVLALKMGAKDRKRRDTMDHDGAVEYLLTLMEYLLKNNNPVDSPPVADGIDLLIDAIRRAPDIRPIKNKHIKHTHSVPTFPGIKSKSSSESEDDNLKHRSENFKDNLSYEKNVSNDTQIMASIDEVDKYSNSDVSTKNSGITTCTTAKYVDVEDMVFNGNEVPKVYIATAPAYDNLDDTYNEKEKAKPVTEKQSEIRVNESTSDAEDEIFTKHKTVVNADAKNRNVTVTVTEKVVMTKFDRLNEEYEKQIKGKAPSIKNLKLKRKKNKRLRKKSKVENKSDVSSITKEVDEEKTRKKVIVEEAILRRHMSSTEDDPFQMEDESGSRDLSPLDAINNEVFPSYFT